jgi:hypothetical protein
MLEAGTYVSVGLMAVGPESLDELLQLKASDHPARALPGAVLKIMERP